MLKDVKVATTDTLEVMLGRLVGDSLDVALSEFDWREVGSKEYVTSLLEEVDGEGLSCDDADGVVVDWGSNVEKEDTDALGDKVGVNDDTRDKVPPLID